jgi:hypothetical protein
MCDDLTRHAVPRVIAPQRHRTGGRHAQAGQRVEQGPRPFVWTKSADELLAEHRSYPQRINDSEHQGRTRWSGCIGFLVQSPLGHIRTSLICVYLFLSSVYNDDSAGDTGIRVQVALSDTNSLRMLRCRQSFR